MPITIKAIREKLSPFKPEHISSNNSEVYIDAIAPILTKTDFSAQHTLYIGAASKLPEQCPANVICIEDAPIPERIQKTAIR